MRNKHDPNAETHAAEPARTIAAIAEEEVEAYQHGDVPEGYVTYGEFLEMTGLDDSFMGDGVSVPGTGEIYEAMMRVAENRRIEREAALEFDEEDETITEESSARLKRLFKEHFRMIHCAPHAEEIETAKLREYALEYPAEYGEACQEFEESPDPR